MKISEVKAFVQSWPAISTEGKFFVADIDQPFIATVEREAGDMNVRHYLDGTIIRSYLFSFTTNQAYDEEVCKKLQNSELYDELSQWLESQNKQRTFSGFSTDKVICDVKTKKAEMVTQQDGLAKYKILCEIRYY